MEGWKATFKKLKTGQIILVLNVNETYGTVVGCSLKSSNLKATTYQPKMIDNSWQEDITEVRGRLQPIDYYNLARDNKYHKAQTTNYRYNSIIKRITAPPQEEKNEGPKESLVSAPEDDGTGYHQG